MNQTKIVDAVHGSIATIDVTSRPQFKKLLTHVNSIRNSLLSNSNLRTPYVELLCSLYKKGSRKIMELQPVQPTDNDVHQYFEHSWPEVKLATPLDDSDAAFVWGFTYVGLEAADNNAIYINGSLINHWLLLDPVCFCFLGAGSLTTPFLEIIRPLHPPDHLTHNLHHTSRTCAPPSCLVVQGPLSYSKYPTSLQRGREFPGEAASSVT